MWHENVLEVSGKYPDVVEFRRLNQAIARAPDGRKVLLPLCFQALLPRPPALEGAPESDVGLRGYQALYGDWEALTVEAWAMDGDIHDRASLIQYLEEADPDHLYLAQRYRANEAKFGFRNATAWNREIYGAACELGPETTVEESAGRLTYRFRSFESAPWAWFEMLKTRHPELSLKLSSVKASLAGTYAAAQFQSNARSY